MRTAERGSTGSNPVRRRHEPVAGRTIRGSAADQGPLVHDGRGDGIWKNRYGSDPAIVGRVVKVNDVMCTIVGVMPPDMKFPFNNDVWVPFALLPAPVREARRGVRNLQAIGLLAPGVTLAQGR